MKLYHYPNTRSVRPLWLLEELGISYDIQLINVFAGEGHTEDYLKLHPHGAVPVLEDEGTVIFEAGAICMYLTEKYADRNLAPKPDSDDRGRYFQWMFYVPATMEPPLWNIFLHTKGLPETKRIPEIIEYSRERFKKVAEILDHAVSDRPFLLGNQFNTPDIMVGTTLQWQPDLLENYPALQAYRKRLSQRPAYQKANAIGQIAK